MKELYYDDQPTISMIIDGLKYTYCGGSEKKVDDTVWLITSAEQPSFMPRPQDVYYPPYDQKPEGLKWGRYRLFKRDEENDIDYYVFTYKKYKRLTLDEANSNVTLFPPVQPCPGHYSYAFTDVFDVDYFQFLEDDEYSTHYDIVRSGPKTLIRSIVLWGNKYDYNTYICVPDEN